MVADTQIDPLDLTDDSTDAEIAAALRPHLSFIKRRLEEEKDRWAMIRQLHPEYVDQG